MSNDEAFDSSSENALNQVYKAIEEIKIGRKRSIAFVMLGFTLTLSSVSASSIYLLNTYSDLTKAKSELGQTARSAYTAQSNLQSAQTALTQARSLDAQESRARIDQAMARVSAGQAALHDISYSINEASNLIPVDLPISAISTDRWFVVVESYAPTPDGERLARLRMQQIDQSGRCSQVWLTVSNNMLSVVVGGPADQRTAANRAKAAANNSLTSAAYARLDLRSNWRLIDSSSRCTEASFGA
jgi:KaiC/GvpD/RAD55 family RecA-like ATPase